jgi:nucleoside-triphosphatase
MSELKKNIFLTGAPSSGKTTIIKKVIAGLDYPIRGFYTEEEREEDRRAGFLMKTLDGRKGYLAHQSIKSEYRIRRYGVSIENIEAIAVPSISPQVDVIIVLDEIGKMECFSLSFRQAALNVLSSGNIVLGTITLGGGDFIQGIKRRDDMEMIEVTEENRNRLPGEILKKIKDLIKMQSLTIDQ